MKDKLLHIEGIRGVACLMVVLSHLALIFYPGLHEKELIQNKLELSIFNSPLSFFYSGTAAVFIFFVLSGYVLTYGVMKNNNVLLSISTMTIRRYFRLAIPVVASCALSFLVIKYASVDTSRLSAWISSYGKFEPSIFGAMYSGLIETFFRGGSAYNPVLWTMKIEFIGSLIIFFYCAVSSKVEKKTSIAVAFSVVIFMLPLSQIEKYSYICFMFGAILNHMDLKLKTFISVTFLCIGVYFGGVHYGSSTYAYVINLISYPVFGEMTNAYYLFCAFSGIFVVTAIIKNDMLSNLFSIRPFVYLGRVSFSVYLIHLPIMYLTVPYIFNTASMFFGYFEASLIASLVTTILIYLASNIFYKAFDAKAIKLSKLALQLAKPAY
ncbi:TPA: acyltransferase family protein [Citrobacter freundii]